MIHPYTPRSRESLLAACALLAAGTLAACADAPSTASQSAELATAGPSMSAKVAVTKEWGAGYCADVTVANSGGAPATSWTVVINLNQSQPIAVWGVVQTTSGSMLTATPRPTQPPIAPGANLLFTFCANKTGSNYVPTVASVTGVGSASTGTGGSPAGTGGSTTGTGGSPAGTGGSTTGAAGSTTSTGGSPAGTGGGTGTGGSPAPGQTITSAAQTCANLPIGQTGTVTYACDCGAGADADCRAGNDASDGKTPATAWRTYQKLQSQFAAMKPGDTLAFCRGGSFSGNTQSWVNASCKAGNVCTVRDYKPTWGSGDEGLPKLVGASLSLVDGGNAHHEEGYQFLNLELDGAGSGQAVYVFNDIKDVLLCNLVISNYGVGINVEASNPPADSSSDGRNARITLRGSRVVNNVDFGWLGGCTGCAVEYSYFDHNGTASALDHDVYLGGARDSSGNLYVASGERVVGNQLFHSAMGSGATCQGTSLVVHGKHDGMLIQGNTIAQDVGASAGGCWGIAVAASYPDAESFTNFTVDGNTVVNVGNASIVMGSCQNCKVQNNLVVQGQTAFGSLGIVVHPNGTRDPADQMQSSVQVLNNTVYFAGNAAQTTGIQVGGEGSGYVVAGNAVLGSASGGWNCFDYDLATSAYSSDYNLCYDPASAGGWVRQVGSLASWQAQGMDKHSKVADPLFVKPAVTGYDFTAKPGSPLRGAGDPAHAPALDIAGKTRPSPPDIGAYQN